ncbi:transcriptional regulator family: Zinc finger, CCHC-type [Trichoderma aggressivum f. europaeum]|uniref:Transcriptional regulator family: Zinc finger, CCHC-type n=1 Tax=Trichoderma aggressivum f. europaeum TaxID=173218 RepID=A0AAE1IDY1_9HYPO|nr:transcriptional regulator family: Zinc finger, CCHC-type [Trichoderma aggressivum f. europaeum]
MKFMQRAVASASSSSPQSDDSSQNSKKRKLRHSATTAAEERVSALIDQASIKAALEDQEAKRQAALAQHTATGAHWVLNTKLDKLNAGRPSEPSLNVVYVGYGDIDSSNESGGEDAPQSGRTSTRKPKEKPNSGKDDRPDEESSSDDEDDDDDSAPKRKSRRLDTGDSSSRSQSRSRPRFSDESKKAKDFREKRKKKEVRLNNISSISAGGGGGSSGSQASFTCYVCKQPGHKAANCPNGASRR